MAKLTELPKDATLEDVTDTLLEPKKHVLNVLFTMDECRREGHAPLVRIGITGEGKAPYHKLTYLDANGEEQVFGSYYGKNRDEKYLVHESTWSTKTMTRDEFANLLGRLRGYKPGQFVGKSA